MSSTTGNETLCFLFFRSRVVTSKTKRSSEKWRTGGSFCRMSCRVASSSDWHLEQRYLMKDSAESTRRSQQKTLLIVPRQCFGLKKHFHAAFERSIILSCGLDQHIMTSILRPTSRLSSISRKSELFSEHAPHRIQVIAYVCVPSNYVTLRIRIKAPNLG